MLRNERSRVELPLVRDGFVLVWRKFLGQNRKSRSSTERDNLVLRLTDDSGTMRIERSAGAKTQQQSYANTPSQPPLEFRTDTRYFHIVFSYFDQYVPPPTTHLNDRAVEGFWLELRRSDTFQEIVKQKVANNSKALLASARGHAAQRLLPPNLTTPNDVLTTAPKDLESSFRAIKSSYLTTLRINTPKGA